MSEFDTGLPSVRQVQRLIKEKNRVEIKLITNDLLEGTIVWQDLQCLCLVDNAHQPTLIWRSAIAYLRQKT